MKWRMFFASVFTLALLGSMGLAGSVFADPSASAFNVQVTPSPLVATLEPGVKTQLVLKVHNGGTGPEDLKISPRAFKLSGTSSNIHLLDTPPPDIGGWISFSAPSFALQPGQWMDEKVTFDIPKSASFSYSFALVINQLNSGATASSGRTIKGSLAIFTLINIDRPGAKSQLQVVSFTSDRWLYEHVPVTLNVRLANTGNTIVQPYGNIFIGRTANAKIPLTMLAVNTTKSYILPGESRVISATWDDGFPNEQAVRQPDGTTIQRFTLDWSQLSHFRIGRYTAHLVAIYSYAGHDIPIEGTVSFWVVPWRAIGLLLLVICGLTYFARWRGKRRVDKAVRKALASQAAAKKTDYDTKETK